MNDTSMQCTVTVTVQEGEVTRALIDDQSTNFPTMINRLKN